MTNKPNVIDNDNNRICIMQTQFSVCYRYMQTNVIDTFGLVCLSVCVIVNCLLKLSIVVVLVCSAIAVIDNCIIL